MMRTIGAFLVSAVLAVGCSVQREDVEVDEGALAAESSVEGLDALVSRINGYGSADAWIVEHPRDFSDTLDDRFLSQDPALRCTKMSANEATVRWVTRDRTGAKGIRKLGLTWSSNEGDVSVATHESYHYDEAGRLRVVVIDREEDHLLDEPFIAAVTAHNLRVKAAHDVMPMGTEMEKVARSNKLFELRDSTRVIQYRLYFRNDGTLFHETKTEGLEGARALDFDAISQVPPSLYSNVHPANVTGAPYLTRLFPFPDYGFRPLTTKPVPAGESMRATLIAKEPFAPEASLSAKPVCR